jgi:hypothetical protein
MAKSKKPASPDQQDSEQQPSSGHYQEWDCKIEKGQCEKLKISREVVKITDEEAETLNAGRLTGGNNYVKMYFKVEDEK